MRVLRSWRVGIVAGVVLVSGGCAQTRAAAPAPDPERVLIFGSAASSHAQPLYVVEGLPLTCDDTRGSVERCRLSAADIESIELLKDAVAYGEKGRNGVVVVRLKSPAAATARIDPAQGRANREREGRP